MGEEEKRRNGAGCCKKELRLRSMRSQSAKEISSPALWISIQETQLGCSTMSFLATDQ